VKSSVVVANVLAWAMACAAIAQAAEAPVDTVVSIKDMHCASCASRVGKKLEGVANVKSVNVDCDKGTALVVTAEGKTISPKAVWEAVESTGYKPLELKGPTGTFKSKPTK